MARTRVNIGAEITGVVRDSAAEKAGLHVRRLRMMSHLGEAFDELREQAWPHGRWKRLRSIISYARQSITRKLLNEVVSDLNEGCKEAISAGSRIVPIGSAS